MQYFYQIYHLTEFVIFHREKEGRKIYPGTHSKLELDSTTSGIEFCIFSKNGFLKERS